MLLLFSFYWVLIGLATAQKDCEKGSPEISLPSCMETCFANSGCGGCPCANNLRGWCEISSGEGPDSWFARWGQCVLGACPDDGDITNLMVLYVAQCDGTVGGPLNNDTVPYPLRDWAPKAPQHLSQSPAASSSATTKSEIKSVETLTGIASLTTKAPESTTISANGSEATVFDHTTSASSQATGTMSLAPTIQGKSRTALNVAAIVGVAIGGAVLLALIVGLVAWILRHRRRNKLPIAVSPPNYEPADSKEGYDKPELDGQVLAYQYSKVDAVASARSPVMYAELDGGRRISPVRELPAVPT